MQLKINKKKNIRQIGLTADGTTKVFITFRGNSCNFMKLCSIQIKDNQKRRHSPFFIRRLFLNVCPPPYFEDKDILQKQFTIYQ